MKHEELESRIQKAFSAATPDILGSLLSECDTQKGTIIMMTEKKQNKSQFRRILATAAVFALVIVGAGGYAIHGVNHTVDSTVSLDINPSIEISVNRNERVLDVTARNEDGQTVIGDMDFSGNDLDVTVNALIGSMFRNGYLTEQSNSILVSVDGRDSARSKELQLSLSDQISLMLQSEQFAGAVLSQTVEISDEIQALADAYGISPGKAQLIQRIVEGDARHTFESLVDLPVNSLALLLKKDDAQQITFIGTSSDKAYIGEDGAREIVLAHAGLTDVDYFYAELDCDNGVMVYEVDCVSGATHYEYEINATTGDIMEWESETDDDVPSLSSAPDASIQSGADYLPEAQIKAIVLEHAGLTEAALCRFSIRLDHDDDGDDPDCYEVEFASNATQYEYEVDALTGAILDHDIDTHAHGTHCNR